MKMNKWTVGLAAAGAVSLASTGQAEENSVLTALSSTVISGNVEASYIGGFSSNNNLYNDGAFEANGASLSIGSPLGDGDYSAGYNVQLLLGQRAGNFAPLQNGGLGNGADPTIKNANVSLNLPAANGIELTLGLFDTVVGYETEASGENPNVIRSFGYLIEPHTHTGLLASTEVVEGVDISVGLTNGFDSAGVNPQTNDGHAQFGYVAAASLTAPESLGFLSGSTLYVGYVNGNNESTGQNAKDDELLYIGATLDTPIDNLSLGIAYDDREFADRADRNADAISFYAAYQLSDSLSLAGRYEIADLNPNFAAAGLAGPPNDTLEITTLTIGYSLWENVLTRLEFGWERGAGNYPAAARNALGYVMDGQGDSSYFALNAFYSF